MKTTEEVAELERQWLKDPCWDLETTEGFEEWAARLYKFSQDTAAHWTRIAQDKAAADALREANPTYWLRCIAEELHQINIYLANH